MLDLNQKFEVISLTKGTIKSYCQDRFYQVFCSTFSINTIILQTPPILSDEMFTDKFCEEFCKKLADAYTDDNDEKEFNDARREIIDSMLGIFGRSS